MTRDMTSSAHNGGIVAFYHTGITLNSRSKTSVISSTNIIIMQVYIWEWGGECLVWDFPGSICVYTKFEDLTRVQFRVLNMY